MGEISDRHPLRQLLSEKIAHHFGSEVGLRDEEIWAYLANLLTEFCDTRNLYALKNAQGRSLDDVGEMLLESDPIFGDAARRLTASARCANTSETSRSFTAECFPSRSIASVCAASAWRA